MFSFGEFWRIFLYRNYLIYQEILLLILLFLIRKKKKREREKDRKKEKGENFSLILDILYFDMFVCIVHIAYFFFFCIRIFSIGSAVQLANIKNNICAMKSVPKKNEFIS